MCVYRRPRRVPSRLELDARMPRLRPASGAGRSGRASRPGRETCPDRAYVDGRRLSRSAGGALGGRGAHPQCGGPGARRVVDAPARVARRASRARAGGEPRRSLPRGLPRRESRPRRSARGASRGARAGARAVELTGFDVRAFLAEDVGDGDVTANYIVPVDARLHATLLLKEDGVVCGLEVAEAVFRELDPDVVFEPLARDGDRTHGAVARISGSARALLTGERTALNLLGRLSGIATLTRRYVDAVAGTDALILDTRKTTPGLRALEKLAVRTGGGTNHRFGLYDAVLIKDNHLRLGGGVAASVRRARETGLPVEVECETLQDVEAALDAGADTILLDNMTPVQLREAVGVVRGRARTEASGGITLETIREVAATGVDAISVGALTHSARSLDVSMEVR